MKFLTKAALVRFALPYPFWAVAADCSFKQNSANQANA